MSRDKVRKLQSSKFALTKFEIIFELFEVDKV